MDLCVNLSKLVYISEDAKKLGIHIAYTISWAEQPYSLAIYPYEDDIVDLLNYVKDNFTLENLKENKVVRAYRDFFWKLGIDPTKTRPASEALVRRALRGQFPRINPVVDAGNIASAYTLIPIGMYDLDKAELPLTIKCSIGGEVFRPIGSREEILGRGTPILVDNRGTVMHIYPHRDSVETCVTESTKKIITVAAGVLGVDKDLVIKAVSIVVRLLNKIGWESCKDVAYVY